MERGLWRETEVLKNAEWKLLYNRIVPMTEKGRRENSSVVG